MKNQQQQQQQQQTGGRMQPLYVSEPYQNTSAKSSQRHRLTTFCGSLLIIAGGLSIILTTVEIGLALKTWTLVVMDNAIRGIICGVMVSNVLHTLQLRYCATLC